MYAANSIFNAVTGDKDNICLVFPDDHDVVIKPLKEARNGSFKINLLRNLSTLLLVVQSTCPCQELPSEMCDCLILSLTQSGTTLPPGFFQVMYNETIDTLTFGKQ